MKTESKLTKHQRKTCTAEWTEDGKPFAVVAEVRYDDQCGNGHNTFAITGTVYSLRGDRRDGKHYNKAGQALYVESCGCVHDAIAAHIPELAPLIKWHLTSSDGPMYYIENTVFLAGDRDCWGLKKGEFSQHTSRGQQNGGVPGVPHWDLEIPSDQKRDVYATEKPAPVTLEWRPSGRIGEGKARELDAARRAAVWPDATDAELSQDPEGLKAALLARHGKLMEDFRAAVESLGFTF